MIVAQLALCGANTEHGHGSDSIQGTDYIATPI